ncbi:MAG: NAD(P)-dependent oxidoreductase [Promethearchaeota archaeon]
MKEKIGWIGTGVMGKSMCKHIIQAGYQASVFNRTEEKAQELISLGATWCSNPKEVSEKSDIVFTIVGFPQDVKEVYFGDHGILKGIRKGGIMIDMTTSEPTLAKEIYDKAKAIGVSSIDAPVSGGDIGAREGTLAIMAGGDKDTYDKILPLFELMGKNIAYMGKAGAGQHTKMSNQILIASTMIGVVESLLYAYKAGNNLNEVINVIGKGAAGCWSINNLGPRIVKGNFDPGFFIKHFVKDMGIALQEAKQMNLSLPGLALAYQFYISSMAVGLENLGTQGLYKVFANMNGIEI